MSFNSVEANRIRARFRDPNLRFPLKPLLAPDVRMFNMPDGGVYFRGCNRPTIFHAPHDASLRFLVPLLNGTRTVDRILDMRPKALQPVNLLRTLWRLYTSDLLWDSSHLEGPGITAGSEDRTMLRQMLFWGRHVNLTRAAESSHEVQERIRDHDLVLVATGLLGSAVFDLLSRSGYSTVRVLGWDDDGILEEVLKDSTEPPIEFVALQTTSVDRAAEQLRKWVKPETLVVAATINGPMGLFHEINRIALNANSEWIHGNLDGPHLDVGPYIQPYESSCYTCMRLRQLSASDNSIEEALYQSDLGAERAAGHTAPKGETVSTAALGAGLLVTEVLRISSEFSSPTLLDTVLRVGLLDGTFESNHILRVPRCPDCYRGSNSTVENKSGN